MSKSPWGNIGAWAAEAEREEAEEREAAEKKAVADSSKSNFPSLKDGVNAKQQKKRNKMSLQEFTMQSTYDLGNRGLTPDEMLRLPTGPKERSPEEMQYGRLGGGFSNYGGRTGQGMGRGREYEGGRRSYGFEESPRGRNLARVSDFNQQQPPSRADGVDDWGSMKKSLPEYSSGRPHSGGKYSSLGGNAGVGSSRADEVDNWASVKKSISQTQQPQSRSSHFGSGFSRPEPERWTRNEGQRLPMEPPKIEVDVVGKTNRSNPFGMARPREDVLAEKGLDWKKLEMDFEVKKKQQSIGGSRPTSSQSGRPGSSQSSRSEVPVASLPGAGEAGVNQKPKVNPFGDAKPREVLLEEKGLDWKRIDLDFEHRRVERTQTEGEKNLKEEIELLNKELLNKSGEDQASLNEVILEKQQELDLLIQRLDDNVRYSQKVHELPSSGAGRSAGFHDRPSSRPGSGYKDQPSSRPGSGYKDRPSSRPGSGYQDRPPTMTGVYEEQHITGYLDRRHFQPGMHEDVRSGFHEISPSQAGAYGNLRAGFPERLPSRPGSQKDLRPNLSDRPHSRPVGYEDPRVGYHQRSSFTQGAYQEPRFGEKPRSQARSSDDRRAFQGGGSSSSRGLLGNRDVDRSGSRW